MPKIFCPPKLCHRKSNDTYHVNVDGKQVYFGDSSQNPNEFVNSRKNRNKGGISA